MCAASMAFIISHSPAGQSTIFSLCLAGFAIGGPLTPIAWLLKRRLWRLRNAKHGGFFRLGLRVDGQGRLVTNEPHPKLVYDDRAAPDFAGDAIAVPAGAR
ncbi:MAG TPA: hypothetical protein VK196_06005 [Magnetospirillum sp.]|nr:hypothetical protein [Magnetospirillum sp.]